MKNTSVSILLVEDNRLIAFAMKRELESLGHTVYTAHSGGEAIVSAMEHQPDVVLMDINLEEAEDGIEIMKQIHHKAGFIPNIYLTGYSQEEIKARARATSPAEIFEKPIDSQLLADTLRGL